MKLIQDIPQWGRKGAIVPVPVGQVRYSAEGSPLPFAYQLWALATLQQHLTQSHQMRNRFYPLQLAAYIPYSEQTRLRKSGAPIERDFAFGREREIVHRQIEKKSSPPAKPLRTPEPKPVQLSHLPAEEAFAVLDEVIPPTMEFYRTPIGSVEERRQKPLNPEPEQMSKKEQARTEAPPVGVSPRRTAANIYGSVTRAEIAMSIRALVNARGMAGRVVVPDEDVRFVHLGGSGGEADEGFTADRVKKLGEFEVEVRVKGMEQPIRRNVRVLSDDEREPSNKGPPSTGVHSGVAFGGPDVVEKAVEYA